MLHLKAVAREAQREPSYSVLLPGSEDRGHSITNLWSERRTNYVLHSWQLTRRLTEISLCWCRSEKWRPL